MALFERGGQVAHIPVHGSDEAVDVTVRGHGAGCVYAGIGLRSESLGGGAHCEYCRGLVVMKRGTATVSRENCWV